MVAGDLSSLSDADLEAAIAAARSKQPAPAATPQGTPAGGWDPTDGMSTSDRVLAGVGRGMVHTGKSVGNWVGLVPDAEMENEKQIDAPLLNTTSGQVGNLIGEAAATAPIGGGAELAAAKYLPKAIAGSRIAMGALAGGAQGAATADPGERLTSALTGAATGGVLGGATTAASKLVNGLTRTPEAQTLINNGVSLTPGQMNPSGFANQMEQLAEHIPVLKQFVQSSRDNAEHQWEASIIQKGAAPGAKPIVPSGNHADMLQQAYDSYAPLYDQAKGYPVTAHIYRGANQAPVPLDMAMQQATARTPGVTDSIRGAENNWLQNKLTQLGPNPKSDDLLQLRSDIRTRARGARLRSDNDSAQVADIHDNAEKAVTASLNSQIPASARQAVQAADSNYGQYKTIEKAVAQSKDQLAGLTPAKVSSAIYNSTPDGAYARGAGGPLRDLAKAGGSTFQTVVPPNGATMTGVAALGAGAAGLTHLIGGAPAAAALGAAAIPHTLMTLTPGGRAFAAGVTTPQLNAQDLIRALTSTKAGAAATGVASQLAARGATAAASPYAPAASAQAAILAASLLGKKKDEGVEEARR